MPPEARDFFHRHHVGQVAHAGAAVFFFHGEAEQALFAQLRPQGQRELVAGIGLGGQRCDLGGGKMGHALAQQVDVFAKIEVQGWHVHCGGSTAGWQEMDAPAGSGRRSAGPLPARAMDPSVAGFG
jgi:hypothetical protein